MSTFGLTPYRTMGKNLRPYSISDTLFSDDFLKSFFGRDLLPSQMKIDVKDEGDKYVLEAELPGVSKEDINIEINDGVLTLSTQFDSQKSEEKDNYVYRERNYGSQCRSFSLDNINDEKIDAKYQDGILVIDLPKMEEAKKLTRSVDIK
ncbi:MAG: Hsp20/alpha crystallin family protein [Clostridiales bacterium]|nr:Hsp20/alpha crystallin family protein [Clostridiales bacterium]